MPPAPRHTHITLKHFPDKTKEVNDSQQEYTAITRCHYPRNQPLDPQITKIDGITVCNLLKFLIMNKNKVLGFFFPSQY